MRTTTATAGQFLLILTSLIASAGAVELQGAGSSLVSAYYADAFRLAPVPVSYTSLGSSKGVCRLLDWDSQCSDGDDAEPHQVDFGSSERLITDDEYADFPDAQMYPAVAAGVVPAVNLPELDDSHVLVLTLDIIARIYIGQVTHWNDSAIVDAQSDPAVASLLPAERILPVARSSGSGTSAIWTGPLANANDDFDALIGTTSSPDFNAHVETLLVKKASGMAAMIVTTPYSIGYLQMGDAFGVGLKAAWILKDSGSVVEPTLESVELAVAERGTSFGNNGDDPEHLTADLHSALGDGAWPISGFGYNAVRLEASDDDDDDDDCEARLQLLTFLDWFYTSDSVGVIAELHGLVLPTERVRTVVLDHVHANLKCGDDLVHELATADVPVVAITAAAPFEKALSGGNVLIDAKGLLTTAELVADLEVLNSETVVAEWDGSGAIVAPSAMSVAAEFDVARIPFVEVAHSVVYSLCNADSSSCTYDDADAVVFSADSLRKVLSGEITTWNDAELVSLNAWLADVDLDIAVHWGEADSESMLRPLAELGSDASATVGEHHASQAVALAVIGATPGAIGIFSKTEGSFSSLLTEASLQEPLSTTYDVVTRSSIDAGSCGVGQYAKELLMYLTGLTTDDDIQQVLVSAAMTTAYDGDDDTQQLLFSITCDGTSVAAPVQEQHLVGSALRSMGVAAAVLGLLCAVFCIAFSIHYRKARIVRYAQPEFLIVISLGSIVTLTSIFFMGWDDDSEDVTQEELDTACMAQVWLYCLGFGLTYSALIAKTMRVHTVFRQAKKMRRVHVSAKDTMKYVAAVVGAQIVILSIWQASDPLVYTRVIKSQDAYSEESVGSCDSATSWSYLLPLAVFQAVAYVAGNVVSYQTRNVDDKFAESKYISACMFQGLQVAVLCVPVAFMTADDPPSFHVVLVAAVWLQVIGVLALVVGPKIFAVVGSNNAVTDFATNTKTSMNTSHMERSTASNRLLAARVSVNSSQSSHVTPR